MFLRPSRLARAALVPLPLAAAIALTASGCRTPTIAESAKTDWAHFGANADPSTARLVPIGLLLEQSDGGSVTVDGSVDAVDAVRGSWLRLRDSSGAAAYVRFAEGRSYVPRNALGRRMLVLGTVESRTLSIDLQRRLATDAGFSDLVVARITSPIVVPVLNAEAVWIQGSGLTDPYRPVGLESIDPFESTSASRTTP